MLLSYTLILSSRQPSFTALTITIITTIIMIGERDSLRGDYALRSAYHQIRLFADDQNAFEMDFR